MRSLACVWCAEPVLPHEPRQQFANGPVAHAECALRMAIGSVAHIEQRCGCYVDGSTAGDPPGYSAREAAWLAQVVWKHQQRLMECP